jgi:mono/diheme cytochrome c family protein
VIGRPVDVAEAVDGTIFVSDDYAGAIYRVVPSEVGGSFAARTAPEPIATDPLARLPDDERRQADERGARHFAELGCAGCHSAERADPGVVPLPLRALTTRYGVDELAAFLAAPTPPMPAVALDASARRDLSVYLLGQFR